MVALFDVGKPGSAGQVVVKSELNAAQRPCQTERECHHHRRRCKHIIQTVKLQLSPEERQDEKKASQKSGSAEESLLILEFMRRGDLHKYLTKLSVKFLAAYRDLEQQQAKEKLTKKNPYGETQRYQTSRPSFVAQSPFP